jgi:tryptophanyl-tRNA synthetase
MKVFSGIRPSGKLHLGNYLGAIKKWIDLQDKADQAIFAVVDLHGVTTPYDPQTYPQNIMDVILDYLAAGVDPKKSLLIRQSKIQQHSELAWLFNTITPVSWLERLPTYKEKVSQVEESGNEKAKSYQNNTGLLTYPVLMAADILLYKSDLVPTGDDQLKHIDIANEIGSKFNYVFGNTFEPVKPYVAPGSHILSLSDPTKKMSKTGDDGIALTDSPDEVVKKVKKATTDSGKEISYNPSEKPGVSNLLTIESVITGKSIDQVVEKYTTHNYVDFKLGVADVIVEFLKPFQERRKKFEDDPDRVEAILQESEEKAFFIAEKTMSEVRKKMGL